MIDYALVREYSLGLSVLYVEDEKIMQTIGKDLFKKFFNYIDVADNGEEGLELYKSYKKRNSKNYDLVITDIYMPKMDGLEMSREIFKLNDEQSIIITSGNSEADYLFDAINMGISNFLTKPLQLQSFLSTIYKVTQHITDHSIVNKHIENLENIAIELDLKTRNLNNRILDLESSLKALQNMGKKGVIKDRLADTSTQEDGDKSYYYQTAQLVENDFDDMMELLNDMDRSIFEMSRNINETKEWIELFTQKVELYCARMSAYPIFSQLSVKLQEFSQFLQNEQISSNIEHKRYIISLFENFIHIFYKWQNSILSADESSIHFFDDSIISDIDTIMINYSNIPSADSTNEQSQNDIFL